MQQAHKNFRGQLDDELVLCYFRRHWITIAIPLLVLPLSVLLLTLGLVLAPFLAKSSPLWASLLAPVFLFLTGVMHHQFAKIFRYYLSTVIMTNQRVVSLNKSVFFHDSKITIDIPKIQEIKKVQEGVFAHLFGFGTIILELSGGDPQHITWVPQPDYYFKRMNEVKLMVSQMAHEPLQEVIRPSVLPQEWVHAVDTRFDASLVK